MPMYIIALKGSEPEWPNPQKLSSPPNKNIIRICFRRYGKFTFKQFGRVECMILVHSKFELFRQLPTFNLGQLGHCGSQPFN